MWESAIAVALVTAGSTGFRRRDLRCRITGDVSGASAHRGPHHQFERRPRIRGVVSGDAMQDQAFCARHDCGGGGLRIPCSQPVECRHGGRLHCRAPPCQRLPESGVVAGFEEQDQPCGGDGSVGDIRVVDQTAERVDEVFCGCRCQYTDFGHLAFHDRVDGAGDERRPGAEVIGQAGHGEPVVLLHGFPQHWWEWRGVLPGLAAHYRVICPDLRGAGWTDAPPTGYTSEQLLADVVALLDALELDQVCLIAHDWGALLGYELCLRAPHRVRKYVSLGVPVTLFTVLHRRATVARPGMTPCPCLSHDPGGGVAGCGGVDGPLIGTRPTEIV